jgi:hypothetical protein
MMVIKMFDLLQQSRGRWRSSRRPRRPAVDDRDANTLGWCEQRRKGIRRHLDLERSRAADVGLKHLKPSEPF